MLEQIEALHGITISTKHISPQIVNTLHPVCGICGETITIEDRVAVCVTVVISSRLEWFHDTENCFERYVFTLAQYFTNRQEIDESGTIIQ